VKRSRALRGGNPTRGRQSKGVPMGPQVPDQQGSRAPRHRTPELCLKILFLYGSTPPSDPQILRKTRNKLKEGW
jgi:hypothetical protein